MFASSTNGTAGVLGQRGRERSQTRRVGQQRAAVVHGSPRIRPTNGRFLRENLEALEVNFVPAIKLNVFFGKSSPTTPTNFDRAEKSSRDGGMAGRPTEAGADFPRSEF